MQRFKTSSVIEPTFIDVSEGPRHSLGVTSDGRVYSWGSNGSSNNLGQLGRNTSTKKEVMNPGLVKPFSDDSLKASKVFVSNSTQKDTGHSAVIDENGRLWMSGCDRWQQLGLGSANGGSTGYTWQGGKLWQDKFVLSESVIHELTKNQMKKNNISDRDGGGNANPVDRKETVNTNIRDVALGVDHTLVLSSNKKDVYAFGKCGDGQCGFVGKPFVSAPKRSKMLSSLSSLNSNDGNDSANIAAICAIESCSITIDDYGETIRKVGKCTTSNSSFLAARMSSSLLSEGIQKCISNARERGLLR